MPVLPLSVAPALPLHEAGKYVAGAYIVFVALILIYVAIMALRLSHMQRDLGELHELADATARGPVASGPGTPAVAGGPSPQEPDPADAPIAGASR